MFRREYLTVASSVAILTSGCTDVLDPEKTTPGEYAFGRASPGFERAEWIDGKLEITFSEDHDMDAYGIRYGAKTKPEDDILIREAPQYGGSHVVDLLGEMKQSEGTPPAGAYHLYAYKGTNLSFVFNVSEVLGKVSIVIKPEIEVKTTGLVDNTNVSLQLKNNGGAPVFIDTVEAPRKSSIGHMLGVGESALVQTNDSPFQRDDNCIIVPLQAELQLNTVPRTDTSTTFQSPHDEQKRVCPIGFGA